MKTTVKLLSLVLVLLMLIPCIVACGGGGDGTETTAKPSDKQETTAGKETSGGDLESDSGDDTIYTDPDDDTTDSIGALGAPRDLENYQYKAYVRKKSGNSAFACIDFWTDDMQSKDAITYAVYQRNKTIEDLYKCRIKQVDGGADQYNELKNYYQNGEKYELAIVDTMAVATCATANLLVDINSLDNIKKENSAYDHNSIEQFTMGGKLYYFSGDMNISPLDSAAVTIFNTELFKQYDFATQLGNSDYADLYAMVDKGTWTVDAMLEMAKSINVDLGQDGGALDATAGDTVGYYQYSASDGYYFYGCGARISQITDVEDGGYPELVINNDTGKTVFDFLFQRLNTTENSWMAEGGSGQRLGNYYTNQTLFTDILIWDVRMVLHPQNKAPYGILPIPKYNEDQDRYYDVVWDPYGTTHLWSIPHSCADLDKASYLFHVMAVYSAAPDGTMDAYYTKTLMLGVAQDAGSRATIQIVRDSVTYDISLLYDWGSFNGLLTGMSSSAANGYGNAVTDAAMEVANEQMNKTLDSFRNPTDAPDEGASE